jgi:hypothetical protein
MWADDEREPPRADGTDDLGRWAEQRDEGGGEDARVDDDSAHLRRRRVPLGAGSSTRPGCACTYEAPFTAGRVRATLKAAGVI